MNSQVVIEVMPLSEVHWAVWVITLQDLQESLSLWVLELEDSEGLGRWDVGVGLLLVDLELLIKADFASLDYLYLSTL